MLALFVINPWPLFYKKGMKSWDIRTYTTQYRGPIAIVESKTNKIVCIMNLVDCIPLTKELWENNFDKHRVSCSFENLPYNSNGKIAYAWILEETKLLDKEIIIERKGRKPYIEIDNSIINNNLIPIKTKNENIICNFKDNLMILYWNKNNQLIPIMICDLSINKTSLITEYITKEEIPYIISQLDAT